MFLPGQSRPIWLLAGAVLAWAVQPSQAAMADWRYCLAPDRAGGRLYLTAPFASAQDLKAVEEGFAAALRVSGAVADVVQCPRADSETRIDEMRRWAERYNLQNGLVATAVDWSPGSAVASLRPTR